MNLQAATGALERLAAGAYPGQVVIVHGVPRHQLPAHMDQLARFARGLGVAVGRVRATQHTRFADLYDQLHDQAAGSIPTAREQGPVLTTLWLADGDPRLERLHFAQRQALPRHGVVLLIDSVDLLSNRDLKDLVMLVKQATHADAPLLVIGSAPRYLPFAARAFRVDGDTCMMFRSAEIGARAA